MTEEKSYGLEEIHKKLLSVLDEFDEICEKNGIHYSLHGGTLLGAERNGKLIPWDDDIDVSMTRPEYEKFVRVMRDHKGSFYLDKTLLWVPRFANKNDAKGIYIDIFVWDYISEKKILQFIKINLLRALQGMMKEDIEYERYGVVGKFLLFTTSLVGKLMSKKTKLTLYEFIGTRNFLGKKQFIHRYNDSYKGVAYIMDKDYMNEYQKLELEGKKYMVNKRYREFLRINYGPDYLTPPPDKDRVPGHMIFRKKLESDR